MLQQVDTMYVDDNGVREVPNDTEDIHDLPNTKLVYVDLGGSIELDVTLIIMRSKMIVQKE